MLIDTHAHLRWDSYGLSLDDVIERATAAGVDKIICVSSSLKEAQGAVAIAGKYPKVVAVVGIHPQDTDAGQKETVDDQLELLAELAKSPKVVAVGECGFDFSPVPPMEKERSVGEQEMIFTFQLNLSRRLGKPIVIHSRNAKDKTVEYIKKFHPAGVWHCFVEDWETAEIALAEGLYLSFNGIITYKSGGKILEVAKNTPLERILLETDAPFLTPEPLRSNPRIKINEPAHVKIVAEKIAEIKGIAFQEVAEVTSENAEKLFRL